MKILMTGGTGLLGQALRKLQPSIIAPLREKCDILAPAAVWEELQKHKPDIVIHAAAITDNRYVEKHPNEAVMVNIAGTANVVCSCLALNIRLVYLSTDYIYKGDRGNYKETDEILPFNFYSWTKLGGECSVIAVKNHLIIRTSFGPSKFGYKQAFEDKWTSKDYVDIMAPLILEAAMSPITGVLNLGTERKTLYDYAMQRNETVKPVKLSESNFFTPYDTSLNLQKWFDYKSDKAIAQPHEHCRICSNGAIIKYLDLGLMPLANNLEFTAQRAKAKERFPLQVLVCPECGLSQLSVVVNPEKMFSYYTYRSSVNKGYVLHCQAMAEEFYESKYTLLDDNSFMIDVAGNDGTLLKEFRKKVNLKVLNVDPAANLTAIAEADGIDSITDFWSVDLAKQIEQKYGRADLITATNVFAHVDNVHDFISAASCALKPTGVLVLEFPYLRDFIDHMEFDTVYFEHLSYFSLWPLKKLCESKAMKILDVEKHAIHGGTIRVFIARGVHPGKPRKAVDEWLDNEIAAGLTHPDTYRRWADKVQESITTFSSKLLSLKRDGYKICAFAASAKGNTLLNCCSMTTDIIDYIADETPEKIGKYSPGTGIPIVNKQRIVTDPPDFIVILSWNFKDEIMEKLNKIYKGRYIIPIPQFQIL